jgi:hypothetical protein
MPQPSAPPRAPVKTGGGLFEEYKIDMETRLKQINQQEATVSQVYYLFICGSTCFARLSAHHQERTTELAASGFTVGE